MWWVRPLIVMLRLARLQNPYQLIWVKWGLAETVKLGLSLADQCKCMHREENPCLKADKDNTTIYSIPTTRGSVERAIEAEYSEILFPLLLSSQKNSHLNLDALQTKVKKGRIQVGEDAGSIDRDPLGYW